TDSKDCNFTITDSNLFGADDAGNTIGSADKVLITLNRGTGDSIIVGKFGSGASGALNGKTISWKRAAYTANNAGTWTCEAGAGIDAKFLPSSCPAAGDSND